MWENHLSLIWGNYVCASKGAYFQNKHIQSKETHDKTNLGWILNPFNQLFLHFACFDPTKRSSEITFAADSFPADPPCPR